MTEQNEEIQSRNLDADIKRYKESIDLAAALERLEKNPDFKKVIETGFFKDFGHNLIMQRSFPEMRDAPAMMDANTRKLDSISEVNHYFRGVKAMGAQSVERLKEAQSLESKLAFEEE